jgi:hypothetical protein
MRCTTGNPYLWQPEPGKQPDHSLGTPSGCPTDWVHLNQVLVEQDELTENESKELKAIALELYQQGYIRNVAKIDRIG